MILGQQKVPPEMPHRRSTMGQPDDATSAPSNGGEAAAKGAWQTWHRNGTRCPRGTVPVRRSTAHDVLRAKSLFDFGKKQRAPALARRQPDAPDVVSGNGHEVRRVTPRRLSLSPSLSLSLFKVRRLFLFATYYSDIDSYQLVNTILFLPYKSIGDI